MKKILLLMIFSITLRASLHSEPLLLKNDTDHHEIWNHVYIHDFNSLRRLTGQEIINIGIGIHSGECMLGTIGEEHRMETTVISDAVNTASRLEGLNKRLNTNILITRESFLKSENTENYRYREIGLENVRGKNDTLYIYEIMVEEAV